MVLPPRMRRSMSKTSVLTSPGAGANRRQQRGAVARHDVGQLQAARPDFRQIVVQPVGQRRVDVGDVACGVDREEAARRVVEVFDRVLQFLEHILLAFAVAGDVGNRPHRVFGLALALAERPNPHPQPAAMAAVGAGDADLFLLPLAFACRLEQPEHRFRYIGIADENPLHRANVVRRRRPREREIGRVGIGHVTAGVGDREAVIGEIGDAADHRIVGRAIGEANDPGREGEQIEQADHRQQREQPENVGLRLRAADRRERDRDGDDRAGHQQHQHDAAAPPRRLVGGRSARGTDHCQVRRSYQGTRPVDVDGTRFWRAGMRRAVGTPAPECLNRTRKRKSIRRLFPPITASSGTFGIAGLSRYHTRRPESPRLRPMT